MLSILTGDASMSFGIAMFNLRSYCADTETNLATFRELLVPGELIDYHDTQFSLPGTDLTFTNLVIMLHQDSRNHN